MKHQFVTPFWRKAYASLPPSARHRHLFHMKAAERWELRLDSAIELWSRLGLEFRKLA